tara:strand:- start:4836 stop:5036 length:201 start_codon:yes stop_codon:yes gene_type:complete
MMKFIIKKDGTVVDASGKEVFKTSNTVESQQIAREAIHETIEENGFEIDEEWEMDDDSIELTVKHK